MGVDAGVMESLDFEQWAVESLAAALDWKAESRECPILYFIKVTQGKWRLARKETKSLQNVLEWVMIPLNEINKRVMCKFGGRR